MTARDIIAIGASAGGITPLCELLHRLPSDLLAAVLVVIHRHSTSWSDTLPGILQRHTQLVVLPAHDGGAPQRARVYIGPANQHMRVIDGRFRIGEDLDVRPARGSIDGLFRSAAAEYGRRVVAVVLSGALNDGTAGMWDVRRAGGIAIVQDPRGAEHPSMPQSAMREVPVHSCLSTTGIADELVSLVSGAAPAPRSTRVLIVEDDPVSALLTETMLAAIGYDVVGAVATGEEAVRIAGELAPDVVLMDIQLAGQMRGTEAGRILWERFRFPLVYLTSYSDEKTLREAAAVPCRFIIKPFRVTQLHAAIQIAIDPHQRS